MSIRFHRDGSPMEIPWPGEGEWATHRMWDYGTNRCCIQGWLFVAFSGDPGCDDYAAYRRLPQRVRDFAVLVQDKANEMARGRGYFSDGLFDALPVAQFNNDPATTDAMRSAFWAELWGSFDYEECE